MEYKKLVDGVLYDMAIEEIAAQETKRKAFEDYERTRPLTESEVSRLLIAQQINTLDVDDITALRMVEFYPEWSSDTDYTSGYKAQRGGKLWRCVQAHTSQAGWEPENAASLDGNLRDTRRNDRRSYPVQRKYGAGIRKVLSAGLCDLSLHPRHDQSRVQCAG